MSSVTDTIYGIILYTKSCKVWNHKAFGVFISENLLKFFISAFCLQGKLLAFLGVKNFVLNSFSEATRCCQCTWWGRLVIKALFTWMLCTVRLDDVGLLHVMSNRFTLIIKWWYTFVTNLLGTSFHDDLHNVTTTNLPDRFYKGNTSAIDI